MILVLCWVSSQHFHSPLSPSWKSSFIPLHLLPLEWYYLHIWRCWCFSWQAWFQLVIHLAWHFAWCSLHVSEIKRWKDTALPYSFPNLEPVSCSMSSSNCWFLPCKQDSQETGKVVWYSYCLKNFPQFVLIHTVKGIGAVSEAEVGVFLGFSCFLCDPMNVGNLISGFSAFSKPSLYIWKFSVHVLLKPSLKGIVLLAWEMSTTVR